MQYTALIYTSVTFMAALSPASFAQSESLCSPAPCALRDRLIYKSPNSGASIAANPNDARKLIVGTREFDACNSNLATLISLDRGANWQLSCLPDSDLIEISPPAVAIDTTGTAIAVALFDDGGGGTDIWAQRSNNGGLIWSNNWTLVTSNYFFRGSTGFGALQVDTSAASPFYRSVYMPIFDYSGETNDTIVRISRSDNGGKTWRLSEVTPAFDGSADGFPEFPDLAVGADGTVYYSYLSCPRSSPCAAMFSKSVDGGSSWRKPVKTATVNPRKIPNTTLESRSTPIIAVDNSGGVNDGRLYVTFSSFKSNKFEVLQVLSDDGGETWSAPLAVAPSLSITDQFMPWTNVSKDGVVAVSWFDRRNDPQNFAYQPFAAFSYDGGASFTEPLVLDSDLTDPPTLFSTFADAASNTWAGNRLSVVFFGANRRSTETGLRLGTANP